MKHLPLALLLCASTAQAAATKQQRSLVGVKRAVATWATSPDVAALTFGQNPHTDPTLRAVWEPERSKLDKLK